jgi:hypothetical protein
MKTTILLLCLTSNLVAQKLLLPDGSDRILQLFDLRPVLGEDKQGPKLVVPAPVIKEPAPVHRSHHAADMVRRFLEPALGPGDDCKVLGDRWLSVLGSPVQIAGVERLLALAAREREQETTIEVKLELMQFDDKAFGTVKEGLAEVVRGTRVDHEAVLDADAARAFEAKIQPLAGERLQAPHLLVLPLQHSSMSLRRSSSYVKDFVCTRVGDNVVAEPVVDVVWDGNRTEVCATLLPDGMLGVWCDVTVQEVEQPIAEFQTTVGLLKTPVTIQLPRVTGARFEQTAVLAPGALIVVATQKVDGSWLLATVRAKVQPRQR